MRRINGPDRTELARESQTTADLRDAIDRLIGYLSRTSWHNRPEGIDFNHIDRLLDDIEIKRDLELDRKRDRRAKRAQERGFI